MVMVIVSLTTLLAIVGLAFSAGLSYMVKSKLNAATDAAGLAAARAISNGINQSEQTSNAKLAAQRFFDANYPANYLMSSATLNDVGVSFSGNEVTITVSASATPPLALFGDFKTGPLSPGVLTETKRKDLYAQAYEILRQDVPGLGLYQSYALYGAAKNLKWEPTANEALFVMDMSWQQ